MRGRFDAGHDAAALPLRGTPTWVHVCSADALATAVERLRAAGDPSVGMWLHVVGRDRLRGADDPRTGEVALVAVARGGEDADAPRVLTIDPAKTGTLAPLVDWLSGADAPYVASHGAQELVTRLAGWQGHDWAPRRLGCTQVAAMLLAEGSRRDLPGLDECVALVLRERIERPALESATDEGAQRLAAACAEVVVPTMRALVPMLRKRELVRVFELECALVPAVAAMERAGLGCDAAAFERVAQTWRDERMAATDPDRIARLDKLLSTYAHWPRDFVRGDRVHCRLHPLAADSGRFSCTDPNLQQVPSEHTAPGLRACFRAPAGRVLVVADYAQIELRVAAHLAPCDAMRSVFREGRDPHRATAAAITGKREEEVTAHERKLAKAVNFGFLFGMGAPRFREYARDGYGVELDDGQARRAREAFFATFPGIAAWHRRVGALEREGGSVVVRTALGRRKRFPAGKIPFNAALNIPVQGTAADGFKRAMIELHPRLASLGGRGVLCVHDEYIAEVPTERAEEARELVVATMREAMASVVTSVPIEVEARVSECWG